jgi:hypothetical protein
LTGIEPWRSNQVVVSVPAAMRRAKHDLEGALAECDLGRRRVLVGRGIAAGRQQAVEAVAAPVEFFLRGDHLAAKACSTGAGGVETLAGVQGHGASDIGRQ